MGGASRSYQLAVAVLDGGPCESAAMDVRLVGNVDPFQLLDLARFADNPGQGEQGYVNTVFESLFFPRKLGAFKR